MPQFRLAKIDSPPLIIPKSMTDDICRFSKIISQTNNIRCQQFLKVLLAAKLRYSPQVRDLKINAIKKSHFYYLNGELFFSDIEPVIHFANDPLERVEIHKNGSIHNDFDDRGGIKGTNIIWIPATDYLYPGIVRMPWLSQFLTHLFCFVPSIYKIFFDLQKSIPILKNHKKGRFIEWNDSFLHGGIPNYSNKTAVALVIRLSHSRNLLTPYKIFEKNDAQSFRNNNFQSQKNDHLEISSHIDRIINDKLLKQNKTNDLWFSSTKEKFQRLSKKSQFHGYKYVLDILEARERLIDKNGIC